MVENITLVLSGVDNDLISFNHWPTLELKCRNIEEILLIGYNFTHWLQCPKQPVRDFLSKWRHFLIKRNCPALLPNDGWWVKYRLLWQGSYWLWAQSYTVTSSLIGRAHTQNDPCCRLTFRYESCRIRHFITVLHRILFAVGYSHSDSHNVFNQPTGPSEEGSQITTLTGRSSTRVSNILWWFASLSSSPLVGNLPSVYVISKLVLPALVAPVITIWVPRVSLWKYSRPGLSK